jgi:hypothetical protein
MNMNNTNEVGTQQSFFDTFNLIETNRALALAEEKLVASAPEDRAEAAANVAALTERRLRLVAPRCTCGEGDIEGLAHCEGCALYARYAPVTNRKEWDTRTQLRNALGVMTTTPAIRAFLIANDRMALKQAEAALAADLAEVR